MKDEKQINIDELKIGMTVTRTEKDGLHFPFFNRPITDARSVNVLKNTGVRTIYIINEEEENAASDPLEEKSDFFLIENIPTLDDIISARKLFDSAKERVRKILYPVRLGGRLDSKHAAELTDELVELSSSRPSVFTTMSQLKEQSDYAFSHSVNVSIISIAIGRRLGKASDELKVISLAGLLHDVGMMKISENIINKPDKLTESEFDEIKKHPELGYKILHNDQSLPSEVATVALQHHEKTDGSGYPLGLYERQLHNITKIVSIADVYDAITSKKSYNHERTPSEALKILFSFSGKHFNEVLVKFFINAIGIYPIGTLVMLDSGELGIILESNKKDLTKPKVLLVSDEMAQKIDKPVIFDLSRHDFKTKKPMKKIISSINPKQYGIEPNKEIEAFAGRFKKVCEDVS
jgi:putative nucleotidyltransferase with HDIG domain